MLIAAVAQAEGVMPELAREAVGVKAYPAAPRVSAAVAIAPAAKLGRAEAVLTEEVHVWNAEGRRPMKNGFTRSLHEMVAVSLNGAAAAKSGPVAHAGGVVAASSRGLVWSGKFQLDAYAVRLRLDDVKLPAGAVLWVYTDGQTPIAFDRDLVDQDGGIWTPTVRGGIVHLEIEIPNPKSDAEGASFRVQQVLELVAPRPSQPKANDDPVCLVDVQCVDTGTLAEVASFKQGVAHLQYVKGTGSFVCSGGLLNDSDPSGFVPYLLTANHCFDSQSSATSLEAYWDWRWASCETVEIPDFADFPRSNGSTLLATSASSDFTFVRLNSAPANRLFFGWTTTAQPNGTKLHRISHPAPEDFGPLPQMYSSTYVDTNIATCSSVGRPNFVYSRTTGDAEGGVYGGSSGSLAFTAAGQVVGQLLGSCGPSPADGCNDANSTVDGSFATTFPSVSQFLGSGTGGGTCTPGSTVLCLNNGRFKVEATFVAGGQSGTANVVKLTDETGYLWFFNASNVEAVVKVVNGCGLNSRFWVFAGGLTDVRVDLRVTDVSKGTVKTYTNPQGVAFAPIQDTGAFATCP
ncbi:MAG TPA: trypsin-like peptidase domain-containing protein [Thermoanaerobaculia bacterium]|nr:trypsin-like peptidase domain-containing protein [Thermoanaerobaculia bacterium]